MSTTLVEVHDCIKNGDTVIIKASVVEGRHGKIVRLTSHSPKCKAAVK